MEKLLNKLIAFLVRFRCRSYGHDWDAMEYTANKSIAVFKCWKCQRVEECKYDPVNFKFDTTNLQ